MRNKIKEIEQTNEEKFDSLLEEYNNLENIYNAEVDKHNHQISLLNQKIQSLEETVAEKKEEFKRFQDDHASKVNAMIEKQMKARQEVKSELFIFIGC
jgi:cell division protein FtsB